MRLRVSIVDENSSRQYDYGDAKGLRDIAYLLSALAVEHDPDAPYRSTSAVRIKRVDLTLEV